METAAVIQNLDLVICADMVIAHLAGALGVPVWLALHVAADFEGASTRQPALPR